MAVLIITALGLGVWAINLPRGDLRSEVLFVHKSFGITLLALVVLRVVVRLIVGAPLTPYRWAGWCTPPPRQGISPSTP